MNAAEVLSLEQRQQIQAIASALGVYLDVVGVGRGSRSSEGGYCQLDVSDIVVDEDKRCDTSGKVTLNSILSKE